VAGELQGRKIVVTGVTGQVAGPVARALAKENQVYGAARFTDAGARTALEAEGVRCVRIDLAAGDVGDSPADADYVLHFAVQKSNTWEADLEGNGAGLAFFMEHHSKATAFLHCSSAAVYQPLHDPAHRFTEDDELGDNHRVWDFLRTYSICKITAEEFARYGARRFGLPTTIARLNVPYGAQGGWPARQLEMILKDRPVPVKGGPYTWNLIHEDDILATIPKLLAVAAVPATLTNWGGPAITMEQWCDYLGELVGKTPTYVESDFMIEGTGFDTTKLESLVGPLQVDWRDGLRRMVEAVHPEALVR
jgi:nucleoside-diphosphate-sugar epimerase